MTSRATFRNDIQGLRALAVMLVVVYHSGMSFLPGGYIGVDIFFVISGFLIAGSLIRELEIKRKIDLASFYARRARRLLPAAVLVLIVTILLWRTLYSPIELKQFSSSAIATASYLSNFWFAHLATDYLADHSNPNPLLHTWSLSVEEQFYFIWPFLLLAIYKLAPESKKGFGLVVGTVIISLISFAFCIFLTSYAQPWAFFFCLTRLWEFGLGALCSVYLARQGSPKRLPAILGVLFGLTLVLVPSITFSSTTVFPGANAALPALGTSLFLICISEQHTKSVYNALSIRPITFIGDISYSLYLWHWPVFVYLGTLSLSEDLSWQMGGIAISIFLAIATYFLVENPIRFSSIISKSTIRSYVLGFSLTTAAIAIGFFVRYETVTELSDPYQQRLSQVKEILPKIYSDDCHRSFFSVDSSPCRYGDITSDKLVVLFGDSHAAHWFSPLNRISKAKGWQLLVFTKSSCPSLDFLPFAHHLGREYMECATWRKGVFEEISKLKPAKVILSNSYGHAKLENISGKDWQSALKGTINQLTNNTEEIFVIRDIPTPGFDAVSCLSRAKWRGASLETCMFSARNEINESINNAEVALTKQLKGVYRIDLNGEICRTQTCSVRQEKYIKYSDSNHLAEEYAVSLRDLLESRLRKAAMAK